MRLLPALFRRGTRTAVRVVVRRGPEWGSLDQDAFERQARLFCLAVNRPPEQVVETARLWDRTFGVSYRETRRAMAAIARRHLEALPADHVVRGVPAGIEPGTVYVLTDDDDWIDPALFRLLATAPADGAEGVVWGDAVLGPIRKNADEPVLAEPWMRLRSLAVVCRSNNYAVSARYFERPDADWAHVFEHGRADQAFRSLRVTAIPRYLSVKNTNPASTVFLENGLRRDFSPARLRTLVRQYVLRFDAGRAGLDPRLRWAEPSITAVGEFFRDLADTAP